MRIKVHLFARLCDIVGSNEIERDVPIGTTVRMLWDNLIADFAGLEAYGESLSSAVNAEYARMDVVLNDGDEVAFLPPVSGGQGAT